MAKSTSIGKVSARHRSSGMALDYNCSLYLRKHRSRGKVSSRAKSKQRSSGKNN